MSDPEFALITLARRGDRPAFEQLVRSHEGRLRGFLAFRLPDPSYVDDIAQEAFLIAFRKLDALDPSVPFYAWLKGIGLNLLRNASRKRIPEPLHDDLRARLERLSVEQSKPFEDHDALGALRTCIERLPGPEAKLVRTRYLEEIALPALAAQWSKSAQALSMSLVRIRMRLRKCVEQRLQRKEES